MNEIEDREQHIRIDPRSENDLEYWSSRLGVPKEEFRRAAGPTS
jgi:hypothetical protein